MAGSQLYPTLAAAGSRGHGSAQPFRVRTTWPWTATMRSCPTGDRKLRALGKALLAEILNG
jgi:hypothetical protein